MEEADKEIKKKVESILFAAGKKIEIAEIAKLCRLSHNLELVESILNELKAKYDHDDSPLFMVQEGTAWKLTVRERYVHVVQDIVKQSELSKTIIETLAVIAYKAPVLQSDIIKIRTNKAYDHLVELEHSGYITREKKGRTKLIKLTQKFFEYFDVPPDKLKERFKKVEELEKAVEFTEGEAKQIKEGVMEKKDSAKKAEEEHKLSKKNESEELDRVIKEKEESLPEIDLVNDKGKKVELKTYNSEVAEGTELEKPKTNIEIVEEKFGRLDVVQLGLPEEQKKKLIEEAERLRKEDELAEKKKKEGREQEKEESEREEKFEKKFKLGVDEGEPEEEGESEEKEAAGEETAAEEGQSEEEHQLEEGSAEEAPSEGEAEESLAEEVQPEEEKEERLSEQKLAEEAAEEAKKQPHQMKEGKRLFEKGVPKNIQEKIDERVEEIVFGKKEEPNAEGEKPGEEQEEVIFEKREKKKKEDSEDEEGEGEEKPGQS